MAATSQYVPFATGASANTYTQAVWTAKPEVTFGYQAGLADAQSVNTALRQTSVMSSALGQFVAANQAANVNDDGNVTNLAGQIQAAVAAVSEETTVANLGNLVERIDPLLFFMGQI